MNIGQKNHDFSKILKIMEEYRPKNVIIKNNPKKHTTISAKKYHNLSNPLKITIDYRPKNVKICPKPSKAHCNIGQKCHNLSKKGKFSIFCKYLSHCYSVYLIHNMLTF